MKKLFKALVVTLLVAFTLTAPMHVHNDECGYNETGVCEVEPRHEDKPGDLV